MAKPDKQKTASYFLIYKKGLGKSWIEFTDKPTMYSWIKYEQSTILSNFKVIGCIYGNRVQVNDL